MTNKRKRVCANIGKAAFITPDKLDTEGNKTFPQEIKLLTQKYDEERVYQRRDRRFRTI